MNILLRLVHGWVNRSVRHPARTLVFSAVAFGACFLGLLYLQSTIDQADRELGKEENQIQRRLTQLDQVKDVLNEFQTFIDSQRETLASLQESLQDLEKRRQTIDPLVGAEERELRRLVELAQRRTWYSRAEGFLFAFCAGIAVQVVVFFVRRRRKR